MEKKVFEKLGWFLILMSTIGLILCAVSSFAWEAIAVGGKVKSSHITEIHTAHDSLASSVSVVSASVSAIIASGTAGSTDAESLQGQPIEDVVPNTSDVLTFDGSQWTPTAPTGGTSAPSILRAENWMWTPSYSADSIITDVGIASDGNPALQGIGTYGLFNDADTIYGATGTFLFEGKRGIDFVTFQAGKIKYYNGSWSNASAPSATYVCGACSEYDWTASQFVGIFYSLASTTVGSGKGIVHYGTLAGTEEGVDFDFVDFANSTYFIDAQGGKGGECLALSASGTVFRFWGGILGTETAKLSTGIPKKLAINTRLNLYDCLAIFDVGAGSNIYKVTVGEAYDGGTLAPKQVATSTVPLIDIAYAGNGIYLATRYEASSAATSPVFLFSTDHGETWADGDLLFSGAVARLSGGENVFIAVGKNGQIVLTSGYNKTLANFGSDSGRPK